MQGFVLNRVGDMVLALAVVSLLALSGTVEFTLLNTRDYEGHTLVY